MVLYTYCEIADQYNINQVNNNQEYSSKLSEAKEILANTITDLEIGVEMLKADLLSCNKESQDENEQLDYQSKETKFKMIEAKINIFKKLKDSNYIPETIIDSLIEMSKLDSQLKNREVSYQEVNEQSQALEIQMIKECLKINEIKEYAENCRNLSIKTLDLTVEMLKNVQKEIEKEKEKVKKLYCIK